MGFTADEIAIGVAFDSNFEQEASAAGFSAVVGDVQPMMNAIAEDLNARGGIAGRQVKVVFYDTEGAQGQDADTTAQAACTKFTEDEPVFAAMTSVSQISNDNLYGCLSDRGVISIGGVLGGGYDAGAHLAAFSPYLYLPAGPSTERLAPTWVDRLVALDYFAGWNSATGATAPGDPVVGLIYGANGDTDGPVGDALAAAVGQELAGAGYPLADSFESTGAPNEHSQAVLRFRQAGVTHVIADAALIQFTAFAAAQGYRPRYGFSSASGPSLVQLTAPPGQLSGALGIGFNPPVDVDNAHDPGDVSPAQARCREIMEASGQDTSQRLGWAIMTLACDAFGFLAGAVEAGGLSPEGVRLGAEALGSLAPASTFAITFPGGRPDGASAARDMAWLEDCRCFAYTATDNHLM